MLSIGNFTGKLPKLWFALLQTAYLIRKILSNLVFYDKAVLQRAKMLAFEVLAEVSPVFGTVRKWIAWLSVATFIASCFVFYYVHGAKWH